MEHRNLLFGIKEVEAFDKYLYTVIRRSSYPQGFFSAHSFRNGKVNGTVIKGKLDDEESTGSARAKAAMNMYWTNPDVMMRYYSHKIQGQLDNVESYEEFKQMGTRAWHDGLGEGTGPLKKYRKQREGSNSGVTEIYIAYLILFWYKIVKKIIKEKGTNSNLLNMFNYLRQSFHGKHHQSKKYIVQMLN